MHSDGSNYRSLALASAYVSVSVSLSVSVSVSDENRISKLHAKNST